MKFKILSPSDYKTTKWPGGDTTELYIYPEFGNYADRSFLFRISSATINTEESTFTKLVGVSRQLMILSGTVKIEHNGIYSDILEEFKQHSFNGEWDTKSYGKAIDFNLMTKYGYKGKIENIKLSPNSQIRLLLVNEKRKKMFVAIYAFDQSMKLLINEEKLVIEKKGMAMIELELDEVVDVQMINSNSGLLNAVITEVVEEL